MREVACVLATSKSPPQSRPRVRTVWAPTSVSLPLRERRQYGEISDHEEGHSALGCVLAPLRPCSAVALPGGDHLCGAVPPCTRVGARTPAGRVQTSGRRCDGSLAAAGRRQSVGPVCHTRLLRCLSVG